MAQLVKLSDYVSRYELDMYRYPSRFVRLKRERWKRLLNNWENKYHSSAMIEHDGLDIGEANHESFGQRFKSWFQKEEKTNDEVQEEITLEDQQYNNKDELKSAYKKEIVQFQLNWASSTISEVSDLKRKYQYDSLLSYLLQSLPDTFFVFYEPAFLLKKAPIDLDIIILTPSELWLITPLLGKKDTIFHADTDRFWKKEQGDRTERILHPAVSLKRMRTVMESILNGTELTCTIKTAILAKEGYIDITQSQQRWKCIDRRNFAEWHKNLTRNVSPIKHNQLKIAAELLKNCITVSELRSGYTEETDNVKEVAPKDLEI